MGRLQRKKGTDGKKKRKQSNGKSTSPQPKNGTLEKRKLFASSDTPKNQTSSSMKVSSGAKIAPGSTKLNYWHKGIQFLREVKIELKKVTWPSRKQTMGSTVVVIILVMIISFFLGVVDIGLSSLIRAVLQ
jgi:preprotein translocase subunit SecE